MLQLWRLHDLLLLYHLTYYWFYHHHDISLDFYFGHFIALQPLPSFVENTQKQYYNNNTHACTGIPNEKLSIVEWTWVVFVHTSFFLKKMVKGAVSSSDGSSRFLKFWILGFGSSMEYPIWHYLVSCPWYYWGSLLTKNQITSLS